MNISRYQFELLAFLEQNGEQIYGMRTLSDDLKISAATLGKGLDALTETGLIKREGNRLGITDAGLAALEPYRVK